MNVEEGLKVSAARWEIGDMMSRARVEMPVHFGHFEGDVANACLVGVGRRRRIVVSTDLIRLLDPPEVRAIVAHEVGHYKMAHQEQLITLILSQWGMLLAGLIVMFTADQLLAVTLLAISLALGLYYWPTIERMDMEADAWALRYCDPVALRSALLKTAAYNRSHVDTKRTEALHT